MPKVMFGQKINFGGANNDFIRLKEKGEKFQLRFVASGQYEGIHFIKQQDGSIKRSFCPRIMTGGQKDCEICQLYFQAYNEAKEEQDKNIKEKLLKEARENFGVTMKFYFPVLDRTAGAGTGKASVLQTCLSVRSKLELMVEAGINVTASEFVLTRTEQPGSDYYSLIRLDSAEVKKLTKEEEAEVEKAKGIDLEALLGHEVLDSSFNLEGENDW